MFSGTGCQQKKVTKPFHVSKPYFRSPITALELAAFPPSLFQLIILYI
jgi:hypothetical protein